MLNETEINELKNAVRLPKDKSFLGFFKNIIGKLWVLKMKIKFNIKF